MPTTDRGMTPTQCSLWREMHYPFLEDGTGGGKSHEGARGERLSPTR